MPDIHILHYGSTPVALTARVYETRDEADLSRVGRDRVLGGIVIPSGTPCKRVRGQNDTDVYEIDLPGCPLTLRMVESGRYLTYSPNILIDELTDDQAAWVQANMVAIDPE